MTYRKLHGHPQVVSNTMVPSYFYCLFNVPNFSPILATDLFLITVKDTYYSQNMENWFLTNLDNFMTIMKPHYRSELGPVIALIWSDNTIVN